MFEKLKAYKHQHGDCLVPKVYKADPALGRWVYNQRSRNRDNKLEVDRKAKLDLIGFVWSTNIYNDQWNNMFERLTAYKRQHGDCLVPKAYKEDQALGSWVHKQRSRNTANKLDADRKAKLDSIGFIWDARLLVGH